jgi:retron-type reverse transcriptase
LSKIIKNPKRTNLRNNEYYDFQSIQDELYAKSLDGETFTDLMSKIISGNNILLAYRNIKKNTGSNTKGTDGKTIAHLARLQPDELVKLVTSKLRDYQPQRVRRVEIPKPDGRMRPLGIPTITTADSFQQPPYSSNITTHHSNSLLETSKVKTAEKIDGNISDY